MIDADMIRDLIVGHDRERPRSKQRAIGPSNLSSPCSRRLVYQLVGVDPVVPNEVNLAAWVGTQIHRGLEIAAKNNDDWDTEVRLQIEVAKGIKLFGTMDAYHRPTRTVLDYKSVGPSALQKYRRVVPENYETQIDIYALMAVLSGKYRVDNVALAFVPRNGAMSDIHVHTRPWDQDRADAALKRLVDLHTVAKAGTAVLPMIPTADDCHFCSYRLPGHIGDIAEACPGHQTTAPADGETTPTLTRGQQ